MVDRKPSSKEDEYFLRLEVDRIQRLRREHQEELAEQEKLRLKQLHYMRCPKCGMELTTSTMADVEIDVCPDCRGIFLDAGELDKLLEEKRRNKILDTIASVRTLWKSRS